MTREAVAVIHEMVDGGVFYFTYGSWTRRVKMSHNQFKGCMKVMMSQHVATLVESSGNHSLYRLNIAPPETPIDFCELIGIEKAISDAQIERIKEFSANAVSETDRCIASFLLAQVEKGICYFTKKDYVKADTIDGQVKPKQVNTMLFGGGFDASDAAINSQELLAALKRGFNQSANIQSHQYTDIYLDLDGNTATTEGVATICTDCPDVKMNVFNTTNGTPTTVEAVMNLGKHECAHKHFVEIFCRSKEIKK
jgi:hypothetical protein